MLEESLIDGITTVTKSLFWIGFDLGKSRSHIWIILSLNLKFLLSLLTVSLELESPKIDCMHPKRSKVENKVIYGFLILGIKALG